MGSEVGGQVLQRQLADLLQPVVTLYALSQAADPRRHPRLERLGPVLARGHGGRQKYQRQQDRRAAPRVIGRQRGRIHPVLAAGLQLLALQREQIAGDVTDAVHDVLAGVRAHQRHCLHTVARFAQLNGLVQLAQFLF
ncbi:hypothetical protein D3C71_1615320 [compost metagenome]